MGHLALQAPAGRKQALLPTASSSHSVPRAGPCHPFYHKGTRLVLAQGQDSKAGSLVTRPPGWHSGILMAQACPLACPSGPVGLPV